MISLPQSVIDSMKSRKEKIPKTLWPYLTKLALPTPTSKKRFDFLHEREWRVPCDISFDEVTPFAVTFPKASPNIDGEELIFQAATEFQELSDSDRISIHDVEELIPIVPHLDTSKISGEVGTVHSWLLHNGIFTLEQLTSLVHSTEIFAFLADVYVKELHRPVGTPLDPNAIGTWAAFLFVYGLREENKEFVIKEIKKSPEYRRLHGPISSD